jgi:hypothetical protein
MSYEEGWGVSCFSWHMISLGDEKNVFKERAVIFYLYLYFI